MNKEKARFWGYIILFCALITAVGGFYIGKAFGFSFIEVDRNNETEELKSDNPEELNLVKAKIEEVIKIINEYGIDANESGDYLNAYAPVIMEKLYGEDYEVINGYKIISNSEYQNLREVFNVTLNDVTEDITNEANYLHKGYRVGYKIDNVNKEKVIFSIVDVKGRGGSYNAYVKSDDYEGNMVVKVNKGKIYFESFVIN